MACEIGYKMLMDDPLLLDETTSKHSIRSPEKQVEIDLKNGYEKVV